MCEGQCSEPLVDLPSNSNSLNPFPIHFLSTVPEICPAGKVARVRAPLNIISPQRRHNGTFSGVQTPDSSALHARVL